jgi:hypothetical protein
MPATIQPARNGFRQMVREPAQAARAQATQQLHVVTDPTEASGDPVHGHATVVIGPLAAITGLSGFGVAVYTSGKWVQVTGGGGGGGGEEYKAGEGLTESGSKPVEFKIKALGIATGMYAAGSITTTKLAEGTVTLEKLSSAVQTKLGEIKAYTAKAAGGLELSGTEFLVKAEGITNAMIVAAAGIPESKLSLPEMVKLTGTQTVTGTKKFITPTPASTSSRAGTNSIEAIKVETGAGGVSTNVESTGGNSAPVIVKVGAGAASTGSTRARGGNSGEISLQIGAGGAATSSAGESYGGVGGPFSFNAGAGGAALGKGEENEGGEGGAFVFGAGKGGEAKNGTEANVGGKGGNLTFSAGGGGAAAGTGAKVGASGVIKFNFGYAYFEKSIGVWNVTAPTSQHAAITNPTTLLEVAAAFKELNEVVKAYGLTK